MTKEELLNIVKPLIGRTNLSVKTLSEYAENMAPLVPDGTKPDDAIIKAHVKMLQSVSGNLSHGISEGIEEWKKNNPPKPEPKPSPKNDPKNEPDDTMKQVLEELAEMKKQNKELSDRFAKEDSAKAAATYWKTLKEKVSGKVKVNDYLAEQAFRGMKPDMTKPVDDTTVDDFIKNYDGICEKAGVAKAAPVNPQSTGVGKGENPYASYMKEKCPDDFKPTNKE